MPYDSACAFAGVQCFSTQRYELGKKFFRSVTQSDSCLQDLLPQRRDSEILSPTTQYHTLRLINIALLSTVPWLNISNRIHQIALSALYIDVCIRLSEARLCSGGHGHWTICCIFVCVRSTVFLKFFFDAVFLHHF